MCIAIYYPSEDPEQLAHFPVQGTRLLIRTLNQQLRSVIWGRRK